jgi:hypothetical protein
MPTIRDALGGAFVFRSGGAVVVMRAYFDDSGTHAGSEVVLWAGFVGMDAWWDKQEAAWQSVLDSRGLQHFHMAECEAGDGPYGNRASRDSLTHDLRQTIIDTGLAGTCVAARPDAWNAASPKLRAYTGSAAELCGWMCMDSTVLLIEKMLPGWSQDVALAFYFDKGALSAKRQPFMGQVMNHIHGRADVVAFAEMRKSPALQACDMLAWELLQMARVIAKDSALPLPRPHFKQFIETRRVEFFMLDEKSIATLERDITSAPDVSRFFGGE